LLKRWRFNVADYYRMGELGILPMDDPSVELIDGQVVNVADLSPWHAAVNMVLNELLFDAKVNEHAIVSVRGPIGLDEWNEPIPDILLLKHRRSFYGDRHPGASEAYLLVEVADSAIRYVREVKVPLYAQFRLKEVWVVDLKAETITTYREPEDGRFTVIREAGRGESIALAFLPEKAFAVDDVIGRGRGTIYE
jgi:Uma2 family endonuclease